MSPGSFESRLGVVEPSYEKKEEEGRALILQRAGAHGQREHCTARLLLSTVSRKTMVRAVQGFTQRRSPAIKGHEVPLVTCQDLAALERPGCLRVQRQSDAAQL